MEAWERKIDHSERITEPVWQELNLLKYDRLFSISLASFADEMMREEELFSTTTVGNTHTNTHTHTRSSSIINTSSNSNHRFNDINSNISYGCVPYAECKNQNIIREKIVRGIRPIIPSTTFCSGINHPSFGGVSRSTDPLLIELLHKSWHSEPQARPDIDSIAGFYVDSRRSGRPWAGAKARHKRLSRARARWREERYAGRTCRRLFRGRKAASQGSLVSPNNRSALVLTPEMSTA